MPDYSEQAIKQLQMDFEAGLLPQDAVISILFPAYYAMVEERDIALATCTELAEQLPTT